MRRKQDVVKKPLALDLVTVREISSDRLAGLAAGRPPATWTQSCAACC